MNEAKDDERHAIERPRGMTCSAAHNWRDSHYGLEPTPGCELCEARQRKLAALEQGRKEIARRYAQAVALGLVDDDDM